MSQSKVLSDVGKTMKKLIFDNLKLDSDIWPAIIGSDQDISLFPPAENQDGGDKKLSLFLYQVAENPFLKNQDMIKLNSGHLKHVPLTLDLFYLITPMTGDIEKNNILLGKVMQVLFDHATVRGSVLQGCLAGTAEELRVTLHAISLEDLLKLWEGFSEKAYKLSVCYQVTPAKIDSTREEAPRRILDKEADYSKIVSKEET